MKRYNTNDALCHAWAHSLEDGSTTTRSMSFVGPVLRSYQTPIAFRFDIASVFRTYETFSMTTSSKHYPALYGATTHLDIYEVHQVPVRHDDINQSWMDEQLNFYSVMMRSLYDKASKARLGNIEDRIQEIRKKRGEIEAFIDLIQSKVTFNMTPFIELLDMYGSTNLQPLINRHNMLLEKENDPKEQAKRDLKRAKAIEMEVTRAQEAIKEWLMGSVYHSIPYDHPYAYLRVINGYPSAVIGIRQAARVQTSKGINMSMDEAYTALMLFRKGKLLGKTIQGFRVDTVSYEQRIIKAGCHTITFDEIDRFEPLFNEAYTVYKQTA